ncbi:MAG: carbohydrate kinase [Bacteroides sp.]|nr:carbohydrate kinase [Bacteroides sp.]
MKYLIGVDEGTTGCKSCIFDQNGNIVSSASREYPSYYPHPGWVEQDIEEIKLAVFDSIKECVISAGRMGVKSEDIVAISHSNQGITMVLLDENEKPVRNRTIGWQDLRYVDMLPDILKNVDTERYWNTGGMMFGTYNIAVLNWLQKYEPENWSRVRHICSHQDYFLRQYGADGFYIDEGCVNFLSMADYRTNEWNEYMMGLFNVTKEQLPIPIHTPGTVVGYVKEPFSALTGLPIGCKVCLGGLDTNCCSLGAGAMEAGTQVLTMGTAGVSILISDKGELDPNKRITVRSNPGFGNYQYYIMTNTGASSFRWFRDELCSMEAATAKLMKIDPYNIITSIAENSKPGANGVVALTCFQGSHTRIKNEKARGTFFGINLGTTKADIAQAILEGICFEMKDILKMNEELYGNKVRNLRLCGGVSRSPYWCQMFADIMGKPIELLEAKELGCLGAAMCAGIGAGLFTNVSDAVDKVVRIKEVFTPDQNRKTLYNEIIEQWNNCMKFSNNEIYK